MKINELVTRRSAVATLALGAASACLVLGDGQVYADDAKPETLVGTQYGFLVEARRCVNCQNCVEACRKVNGTPDRRRVTRYESDFGAEIYISTSCMHCEKPSCADVCPAGAINKRSDGIVVVDNSRCIGCKYCYQACPFGVPRYGSRGMEKCDCCLEAGINPGDEPNCVKACIFGALHFGTIEELEAKRQGVAKKLEGSTGPSMLIA